MRRFFAACAALLALAGPAAGQYGGGYSFGVVPGAGGGTTLNCPASQWVNTIGGGSGTCLQPTAADITGLAAVATSGSATDLGAGTLPAARLSGSYTGITGTGILAAGQTGAGFTIALGASTITGILPSANGGAGTVNGILKANGAGAVSAAAAGTDYLAPAAIGATVQAFDADLSALAANATDGLWAHTGAGTGAARTLTAPAAGLTITNPSGIAGNPTFALANDLAALEGLGGTGIARRTGTDAWSVGTNVTVAEGGTQVTSLPMQPQGRLTLTTGVPVLISTVAAATTILYTPYTGAIVPFYDGTSFYLKICAEISNVTTNSAVGSAGPAAVAANSVYDLFVWDSGGTCTLTRGPLWTNDTTRSAGTALVRQNGIYLNNTGITNGPNASRGTYVGTVRSNASSQIDFIFGGAASGGTAASLMVWNAYNRVTITTIVTDSGVSYAYSSATIRQARASAGNGISWVIGIGEDGAFISYLSRATTAAVLSSICVIGVGVDATTGYAFQRGIMLAPTAAAFGGTLVSTGIMAPQLGVHTISGNENGDGTNTCQFNIDQQASLHAMLRM